MTHTKKTFIVHSVDETRMLGLRIGRRLSGAMIIALNGDLGSGKTSFAQGLAKGLDVSGDYYITSPTYNIINEYPGRYPLFHIDLYRIGETSAIEDLSDLDDIGFEDILRSESIVAIEWADMLPENVLPVDLSVSFEIMNDTTREIHIVAYGSEAVHLLENIDLNSIRHSSEGKEWA